MRVYLTLDGTGKKTVELVPENDNEKTVLGTFIPVSGQPAERYMALTKPDGYVSRKMADSVKFVIVEEPIPEEPHIPH